MPTTIRATKPAILIASLLLTTGFAVAGPAAAMADDTVQTRGAALPTSIVNGDFEYLGDRILSQATDTYNFANVDYVHGQASTFSSQGGSWFDIAGFDADAFGWKSTQTDTSVDGRAPIVEIQQSHDSTNVESTAFAWNNEWDTYEGTYTIPAGQPITRFTFRSVRGTEGGLNESVAGNNVDDISFQISYPLAYALNGGQGATPNEQ